MARTRFMPPPQIGVAEQTYRTFPVLNREIARSAKNGANQFWTEAIVANDTLSDPRRRPAEEQTAAPQQTEHSDDLSGSGGCEELSQGYAESC